MQKERKKEPKRAIALAGGGPALGLNIGVLKALHEHPDLRRDGNVFDVWTCACIGAWVGVAYNQSKPGTEFETTREFFRKVCRPDAEYAHYPIAAAFAADLPAMMKAGVDYLLDPKSYDGLIVPESIKRASEDLLRLAIEPHRWNLANFNSALLNDVFAVNPLSRLVTSLIYLTSSKGLARIYYPHSDFLESLDFSRLYEPGKPAIYYNSYNLTDHKMELFSNKKKNRRNYRYGPITAETLCACSALPYIEEPVTINGKTYVEGATIDTVNFEQLMENHPDLDEIWVCRILDRKQVRPAKNLYDALNNLITLFASTTGEDDVKIFRFHAEKKYPNVKIFEIDVPYGINYDWTWSNLEDGIVRGYQAACKAAAKYPDVPERAELEDFIQPSAVSWPAWAHDPTAPAEVVHV